MSSSATTTRPSHRVRADQALDNLRADLKLLGHSIGRSILSYRNDHDAALHRVDALEGELRQLREARAKQPGPTPPPPAPSRIHRVMFAGGLLALVASIGVVLAEPVTESVAEPAALAPVDVSALRTCRAAIAPSPHFDAAQTDPRRTTHAHVRAIEKTGAPCRAVLDQELAVVSGELRERLRAWVVAEDELVGAITRTVVYYEADPYAVDGYRSAPQLWREYDRAVEARDLALARVAPML